MTRFEGEIPKTTNADRAKAGARRQYRIAKDNGYERLLKMAADAAWRYGPNSRQHKGLVRQARAVKVRADHPKLSVPDLADKAGMTRNTYAALLNRGLRKLQEESK